MYGCWFCVLLAVSLCPPELRRKRLRALEMPRWKKELYAVELKWMQAEHDKKMSGPESMGEMWMDDFFDVLPGGRVVNKQEMMDMMGKADPKPAPEPFRSISRYAQFTATSYWQPIAQRSKAWTPMAKLFP